MSSVPKAEKKVLADLKTSILRPALTSHFQCWFYPPASVRAFLAAWGESQQDERWSLACSEAALPATSLATHQMSNDFTGITERHVYRRQYNDTSSFTFYVDSDYKIINFFERWIGFIVNEGDATGYLNQDKNANNYFYRVRFPQGDPDDTSYSGYQTSIYIKKFEKDYNRILEYKFLQAYPISIDSMPVTYDTSQLLKCTVNFNFSRYFLETKLNSTDENLESFNNSGIVLENQYNANEL